ncbi:MAG TPA: hypothetical protein VIU11_00520, partial [Nakamurella sp.]
MTDLADELTDADMLAMWRSAPRRASLAAAPEPVDSPFDPPVDPQPRPEVEVTEESLEVLEGRITSMAARLAAETREWLALVAEFNRRKGWVQWGMRSAANWLS